MIDARIDIERRETLVHMLGPAFTPFLQEVGAVPVAVLRTEPVLTDLAGGQHHMGMRLRQPVGADVPMHVQIGDHAARHELVAHEVTGQLDPLCFGHLTRDRELDFARQLRVLAQLDRLDLVPQGFPVVETFRRVFRQHHLGMLDAGLVGEIVGSTEPLVVQSRRGAIGSRRQRARPGRAGDHLRREVIERHDGDPSTLRKRRRHDV